VASGSPAARARFRAVFDEASEFVFLTQPDGTLTQANRAALTAAGVAAEDLVAHTDLGHAVVEPRRPAPRAGEERRRRCRPGASREVRGHAPAARRLDVVGRLLDVRGAERRGEVTMLVSESRDVTERVRAHEALLVSGARYRTLIESAPEAIVVLDVATGHFVDCNQKSVRDVRRHRDRSPLAQACSTSARRRSRTAARRARRRPLSGEAIAGGRQCSSGRIRRWPGASSRARSRWSGCRIPSGTLIRGSIIDITRRQDARRAAAAVAEDGGGGRLAGGVAHDFNNLLTVITLSSHMLLDMLKPGCAGRAGEGRPDAAERASALTRQLLTFGRKDVLAPKVLDINASVREAESMLRRLIGEDILLVVELDPDAWPVTIDPGHLSQVLMNLSVNARDAMPRGGTLASARPTRGSRVPAVSDSGMGMPSDVLARVFEPFFTSKGVGKGTGLGLAVVHGIVDQSGGRIEVESEPGRGATFSIYLPKSGLMETAPSDAIMQAPRNGHESILLVEDEASLRQLAAQALRARGFSVLLAADRAEALRGARGSSSTLDLLVTDVVMPNMDGRELADRLRARIPGLKVLFLSGYMDDALLRRGVFEANETLLQKPFTPSSLAQRVCDVLDLV
jgi:PAS domain S-box-containing protein